VLNIDLRGATTFKLAERLMRDGVRFVFETGYDGAVIPRRFRDVVRCEKPIDPRRVARALFR